MELQRLWRGWQLLCPTRPLSMLVLERAGRQQGARALSVVRAWCCWEACRLRVRACMSIRARGIAGEPAAAANLLGVMSRRRRCPCCGPLPRLVLCPSSGSCEDV